MFADYTALMIAAVILLSGSGFFLKHRLGFNVSAANCFTPLLFTLTAVAAATQLRSLQEAVIFYTAALIQFFVFILVSRFRQRSSFFWHVMAALGSNGAWYVLGGVLSSSGAYWMLFILHVLAIVAGRTAGVIWAQYIEQKYELKADATLDDRLAPGQRWLYIKKEKTFWVLVFGLFAYIVYGAFGLTAAVFQSVLIVIGLGILQNFSYSLNTRAAQRGNNTYIIWTSLFSGITFLLSATYLFSKGMPLVLFVPYLLSTTLGSATGALCSMFIEWASKLKPDEHLESKASRKVNNRPYMAISVLAVAWILFQAPLFRLLGWSVEPLKFPISAVTMELPRFLIMLTASLVFLFDTALHSINSRAGSRNHSGYHVATCIPKGLIDFAKVSYIAQNSRIPDIVPIGVLAGCLGSLYGKDLSQKIERWLQAKMDVPPPVPAKTAPAR